MKRRSGFSKKVPSSDSLLIKHRDISNLHVRIRESFEFPDLKILSKVPNLKNLSIFSDSLTSLSGIEQLVNLENLYIYSNSIKVFQEIRNLKKIKSLSINSKVNFDIPLEFKKLETLKYSCNYNLEKCNFPSLKKLSIHQAVEQELDYEDENFGVEYALKKKCSPITLSHFGALNSLTIYSVHLKNIDEVSFPPNLKSLTLSRCKYLEDVSTLDKFDSLEELNISFCDNIKTFEFLKNMDHVNWRVRYQGRFYENKDLEELLNHPKGIYYFVDPIEDHSDDNFYNFHLSVMDKAKVVFEKYHQMIIHQNVSRKEFLDLIFPLTQELEDLCSVETCNINWNDEETYYLLNFLHDMSQVSGHEFRDAHFYARMEY